MKTKVASLLVVLMLAATQLSAQKRITVEAQSYDISDNLDLKAVASIFGDSRDLEEFEMKLNDYDSQISNLDLNNDGEVDYLRVIETSENDVHVVVIQAVLDRDVYQDVATIVVEKNRYNRTVVQVIGDPYMYGDNYIIEPVYYHTPSIFSFFWSRNYHRWYSPYYWGYYPRYYRYRRPFEVNIYLSNIHLHINSRYDYRYSTRRRNDYSIKMHSSIGRNDYYKVHPNNSFKKRNENAYNKNDFERSRNSESIRRSENSYNGSRENRYERNNGNKNNWNRSNENWNNGNQNNGNRDNQNRSYENSRNSSPTWNGGGTIQRNPSTSNGSRNNNEVRIEPSRPSQPMRSEPNRSENWNNSSNNNNRSNSSSGSRSIETQRSSSPVVAKPAPTVTRESSNSSNRVNESKSSERRSSESRSDNGNKSSRNDSKRK